MAAEVLARYDILDTPPEAAFDDLARRAAEVFGADMAGVSFFDAGDANGTLSARSVDGLGLGNWREWFKARVNFPVDTLASRINISRSTERIASCTAAIIRRLSK